MAVKKRKPKQNFGPEKRYFNRGARAENDDNEVDKIGASDDDDDVENDVAEEKLQEGDDDFSGSSENDVNEEKDDSDKELGGSDNDSDENEATDSEEEKKYSSHRKLTPLEKHKTTKEHKSPDAKKVTKSINKLPKFQGTPKENGQNELKKKESSPGKRKKVNESPVENELLPAKKLHALDDETTLTLDKRREERDARSLFLKNLPPNTTVEKVKTLSPEILSVRIPLEGIKNPASLYAFVEFENEDAAERNYKKLSGKQVGKKKLIVDYCGEKSKFRKAVKEYPINAKRLFIPNVPVDISLDDLKEHFPEARSFSIKLRGTRRLVFAAFETEDEAKEAFTENANLVIQGKKITVLYAFKKKSGGKRKPRNQPKIVKPVFEDEEASTSTSKAQKVEPKGKAETKLEVTKIKRKPKKKKNKSNFQTDKMNS